jgi:Zn-dependent peptidase ImmA (M78 family)
MSRRRASSAARQLLRKLDDCDDLPIDVEKIAARLGIEVVFRALDAELSLPSGNTSALLLRRHGRSICVVNENHAFTRRRFSIAHEIGHFLLHPPKESYDVIARDDHSSEGIYREEIEANAFAAELLMPEHLVRSRVKGPLDLFSEECISELAALFNVSQVAMTHRLTYLGLLPQG